MEPHVTVEPLDPTSEGGAACCGPTCCTTTADGGAEPPVLIKALKEAVKESYG